eukprot:4137-Chlamydomonas_euryale.AAC.1
MLLKARRPHLTPAAPAQQFSGLLQPGPTGSAHLKIGSKLGRVQGLRGAQLFWAQIFKAEPHPAGDPGPGSCEERAQDLVRSAHLGLVSVELAQRPQHVGKVRCVQLRHP